MKWILVGPRASGKSTIGKQLSKKWHCDFVDLDNAITEHSKKSPNEWIQEGQEQLFRHWEAHILKQWALKSDQEGILATGGGAPLFPETLKTLKHFKAVIWLRNSPSSRRDVQEKAPRARLNSDSLDAEIAWHDWSRNSLYDSVATHTVNTDLSSEEVLLAFEKIKEGLN